LEFFRETGTANLRHAAGPAIETAARMMRRAGFCGLADCAAGLSPVS
jgi:hypothetical protein